MQARQAGWRTRGGRALEVAGQHGGLGQAHIGPRGQAVTVQRRQGDLRQRSGSSGSASVSVCEGEAEEAAAVGGREAVSCSNEKQGRAAGGRPDRK
jgi:hypothetical protein